MKTRSKHIILEALTGIQVVLAVTAVATVAAAQGWLL